MTGSPSGRDAAFDGSVIVVHSRRLVAETLCIALSGIGIDAALEFDRIPEFALVETSDPATIERLTGSGATVVAFGTADPITVARALRAGAVRHLRDDAGFLDVADHLRAVAAGASAVEAGVEPADRSPLATLTRREREILRALVSGRRAADIAETDYVSVTTVRNQIQSILTKLGAHSQLEAVAIAVRAGWTPLAA